MSPERCRWAMHQRPEPSDPARQQGGVLIFRHHDSAVALEGLEVFCLYRLSA